jgi:nitrate reductase delta subunit
MLGLSRNPPLASSTLRVMAALLSYPSAEMRACLDEMGDLLQNEAALSPGRRAELRALIGALQRSDAIDAEADYVQLFDRGRATALHLFEHVHGDSRDRGPAMIDLAQMYAQGGLLLAPGELPDYLPAVLEFASSLKPREARDFIGEFAHILNVLFNALQQRGSAYASVLGALLELAGEPAQAVKIAAEEPLDESWAEPVAFDGCSSRGQARPGQPQPIAVVRRNPSTGVVA